MAKSLLFLPDLSGFTEFVHSTEIEHSQHVIAELLEVLIDANETDLKLAEIEGDALFFYKEEEVPSQAVLLKQIERMYKDFYRHLKRFEQHRICQCNACASAPDLQLKIIAHCGDIQFIKVKESRKPFGQEVIQAHRLMKNSVPSDNYILLSDALGEEIDIDSVNHSLFNFNKKTDTYDFGDIEYYFSEIDMENDLVKEAVYEEKIKFDRPPDVLLKKNFNIPGAKLLEYISNYRYRLAWAEGIDKLEYNEQEVTKVGTEHLCVINGQELNFKAVVKDVKPNQLVYGELTKDPPPVDELYQFFVITPIDEHSCQLDLEVYFKAKSIFKRMIIALAAKRILKKKLGGTLDLLFAFTEKEKQG